MYLMLGFVLVCVVVFVEFCVLYSNILSDVDNVVISKVYVWFSRNGLKKGKENLREMILFLKLLIYGEFFK